MNQFIAVVLAVFPYWFFISCVVVGVILYRWAKKRKAAAIGIGMMLHVLMPVPNVEKSIIEVVEKKQLKQNVTKQKSGKPQ